MSSLLDGWWLAMDKRAAACWLIENLLFMNVSSRNGFAIIPKSSLSRLTLAEIKPLTLPYLQHILMGLSIERLVILNYSLQMWAKIAS